MTRDAPFNGHPRVSVLLLLIAVTSALPFVGALGGPYLWDDIHLIEDNPQVHSLAHFSRFFTQSFFDTGNGSVANAVTYFRPLLHLSYALDWRVGGGNPAIMHATNLLLTMLVTGLVADCLMRWTQTKLWALLGALVFAWHPTKAESIAWISGRTDLLATLFLLLACKARSKQLGGVERWCVVEVVATMAAYASKETAVVLPAFIAIEFWAHTSPVLDLKGLRSLVRGVRWQIATACAYLAIRSQLFPLFSWSSLLTDRYSLSTRAGLFLDTLGEAAMSLAFPFRQTAEHGLASFDASDQIVLSTTPMVVGGVFLLGLLATIGFARRRAPGVAVGSAIALLALGPTSNLCPTRLQCIFYERFLYLPSIGVAFVLTCLLARAAKNRVTCRVFPIAIAGVLVLACVRSVARANDYTSAERFWTHELEANPLSTAAHQSLVDSARSRNDIRSAVQHLSDCHRNAIVRRQHRTAIRCAYDTAALIADTTPDLDTSALHATRDFFQALVLPSPTRSAQLALDGVTLMIDPHQRASAQMVRELTSESFAMLASIGLKLDDPTAIESARSAVQACRRCRHTLRAARVLAARGEINEAMRLLDELEQPGPLPAAAHVRSQIATYGNWMKRAETVRGPAQIQAVAQAHLALGRYGAAYSTLKPYAKEIASNSQANLQYAQIAYYAGDTATAQATLGSTLPPQAARAVLDSWKVAPAPLNN